MGGRAVGSLLSRSLDALVRFSGAEETLCQPSIRSIRSMVLFQPPGKIFNFENLDENQSSMRDAAGPREALRVAKLEGVGE